MIPFKSVSVRRPLSKSGGGLGGFYGDDTPGGDNAAETPGGVLRGGRWTFAFASIFYVNLSIVPETTHIGGGFRCVYAP